MQHILLIDDDQKLCEQITRFLTRYDLEVTSAHSGIAGIQQVQSLSPDLVILDLMMPGQDGFEVCRQIRNQYQGKILMMTASDDDMDHVAGIEMGADDFLTKPVHPRVLLARIKMLLRRDTHQAEISQQTDSEPGTSGSTLLYGALLIKPNLRRVSHNQADVNLTDAEFDMLLYLAQHSGEVISRDELSQQLRGIEYDGLDRTIDIRIAALRKKFQDDSRNPSKLITIRGKGYMFVPESW